MIRLDPFHILMIEPKKPASIQPVIDELTKQMTAAWRKQQNAKGYYLGFHRCICNVGSDNTDHFVGNKTFWLFGRRRFKTNSLCVHYLAFHRDEVPKYELIKVRSLPKEYIEPNERELIGIRISSEP